MSPGDFARTAAGHLLETDMDHTPEGGRPG